MQSARKLLEDLLVENEGFQDLRTPVLLASGQVGIYYVFTEKTFPGLDFKIYGDDAAQMQNYVLHQMKNAKKFMQIMNSVAERAKELLKYSRKPVISGGQTRDWLFSMVVAKILNMPHVAIYKPEGGQNDRYEILSPSGKVLPKKYLRGADAVHVVDLITEASSCYSEDEQGKQVGWIPILRRAGVKVHNLLAMISRKEGGEKNLAKVDVTVESCVQVDADFLRKHAKHKRIALTYVADPEAWAKNYIARHGLKAFERSFCPAGTELERARRFLQRYGNVLKKTGRLKELDAELHREYGFSAIELAHGKNSYTKGNTFTKSWQKAVQKKNSLLCAGLDPGEYWSQNKDTLPKSANKFKWCLQYIDDIAPYAAAVKINRQFIKGLGEQKIKTLTDRIHKHGMVAIIDEKLTDIGNTNNQGFYESHKQGFDAATYCPFPGNTKEASQQAHGWGMGIIALDIMSNPEFKQIKLPIGAEPRGIRLE